MRMLNIDALFYGMKRYIFLGALILASSGCASLQGLQSKPALESGQLKIRNVSLSPKTFYPEKGEKAKITFNLSKKAKVTTYILDSEGGLVRELTESNCREGYNTITWDGRDYQEKIVIYGTFTYVIIAKSDKGEEARYDPLSSGGLELKVSELTFDKEKKSISYVMPKAGRVRIRLGIKDGGPLLRTLIDWQPREAGENSELWDGLDGYGIMGFSQEPKLQIAITAFSLPENTIIAQGENTKPYNYPYAEMPRPELSVEQKRLLYKHALHKREDCHEPGFKVEFIGVNNEKAIPVSGETIPIRVTLDEADGRILTNERYEVAFFIDNVFLFEEDSGFSPYTYTWNTKGMSEGEHFMTVTVQSYGDHIGSVTQKVVIKKPHKDKT